jgi:hypothetical protein
MRLSFAGIAQLVEQLTCNQKVPSSTLGAGTNSKNSVTSGYAIFLAKGICAQSGFNFLVMAH